MNLYLITQNEESGYDTFDSAVVAAKTALAARKTHPCPWGKNEWKSDTWAHSHTKVESKLIGKAHSSVPAGVVLASFNAG